MKKLLIATVLATLALAGPAFADDDDDDRWEAREDYLEARREARKDYEEALREASKDRHEEWKDREEAAREYAKERREAEREYAKEMRESRREYWKDREEAEREYRKDQREAMREREKAYRRWARGERIPRGYMGEPYYVRDYRAYDLAPPPSGYMWVRPHPQDETYYLVQLATGLISRILGN
jgi:Ni/Co efflux regulator RcnB